MAHALLHASNYAHCQPFLNLQLARTYLNAADPKRVTRTWQEVMEELTRNKRGSTQERYGRAIEDRAFDPIRELPVMESRSEHFLKVLANQRSSTNLYLRRIHNFALGMDWLLKPIIPRLEWPKVVYGEKRAITRDEHRRIIAREPNEERRTFTRCCGIWEGPSPMSPTSTRETSTGRTAPSDTTAARPGTGHGGASSHPSFTSGN